MGARAGEYLNIFLSAVALIGIGIGFGAPYGGVAWLAAPGFALSILLVDFRRRGVRSPSLGGSARSTSIF